MQAIKDLFAMLSSLFTTVNKTTVAIDLMVDQTTYGLVQSRDEAAKELLDKRESLGITQEDINKLNKDIFG